MWIRLHSPPKRVARVGARFRNARQRWLFARSKERYDRRPESIRANELFRAAFHTGEIGSIDVVRFIASQAVSDAPEFDCCLPPGECCMPGLHFPSECHTAADVEAMYQETKGGRDE